MPATPKSAMRTRKQDKSRQSRADAKARKACVDAVWERYGADAPDGSGWSYCAECGRVVERKSDNVFDVGHVHEKRARSLGGNPHDPDQCVLLCYDCHFPNGAHRRSESRQA